MRRMSFLFLFLSLTPRIAQAQATEFVVGGDWIFHPPLAEGGYTHISNDWWNMVKNAGLKWVGVYVDTAKDGWATNALDAAVANNRQMTVVLGHAWEQHTDWMARGYRWRYHPECGLHFDTVGRTGRAYIDGNGAVQDADCYKGEFNYNCWRAKTGDHQSGYLCRGVVPLNNDTVMMHVRVKLRLPTAPPDPGIQALQVYVICGQDTVINHIITGGALKRTATTDGAGVPLGSNPNYGEVYVGSFNKVGNQSVDVQLYWFGAVTVHVDYIAVDNEEFKI